jgi:hypothetical protein
MNFALASCIHILEPPEKNMTYLFFTNSLGQSSKKSWKRSIDIILEEPTSNNYCPFSACFKKIPLLWPGFLLWL